MLDESRMARAAARLETVIAGRGPARARQKLQALGLGGRRRRRGARRWRSRTSTSPPCSTARSTSACAVRRGDLRDPATVREVVGSLVRQGFAPGAVLARLRARGSDVDDTD